MGRTAQPLELAKLKGAHKHDPQRYRLESPKNPYASGNPPDLMGEAARAAWFEIQTYSLPGVLTASERFLMEFCANGLVEYRCDPSSFSVGKLANLINCFARLGFSPADRQKLGAPKKPEKNGFEDFA